MSVRLARCVALVLLALLCAGAAEARKTKKGRGPAQPRVRPELDPKLPGHALAFARVKVTLDEPADLSEIALAPDAIKVVVHVEGYALGPAGAKGAPFALLLVDDETALRIDDAAAPLLLRGLRPGPHLLRVVLSRPWGEVVKAPGALALSRIWVGPKLEGPAGKAAEHAVWPDPKKPLLTCVFPLPEEREGGPALEVYPASVVAPAPDPEPAAATSTDSGAAAAAGAEADAGAQPAAGAAAGAAAAADSGASPGAVAPRASSAPASPQARAPQRPLLDFFLSGATLKPRGRGDKLRLVVDKKELPLVREWKPVALKLKPGEHRLTVDLLDRRGTKVRNAVNRTDRSFTLPE